MRRSLRTLLSWTYAVAAVLCILIEARFITSVAGRRSFAHPGSDFWIGIVWLALPLVCAIGWWVNWKERPPSRFWGILISVLFLLLAAWREEVNFTHPDLPHRHSFFMLAAGVLGLVAFSGSDKDPGETLEEPTTPESDQLRIE
jgi:hypothetical protein